MTLYLGIDTSAYTTSIAAYNSQNGEITDLRHPLEVKAGEKGLRQSEAFFQHVNAMPGLVEALFCEKRAELVRAIGVSLWPRRVADSYMPVFRAGLAAARVAAQMGRLPLYGFSHQEGHIFAGLYEHPEILLDAPFIAIHFSGGTSEILSVDTDSHLPVIIELLAGSSDLNVGQLIDRVGVKLGLAFPAGAALEGLALQSATTGPDSIKIPFNNGQLSFSGAETRAYQLLDQGVQPADVARMLLNAIADALAEAILYAAAGKSCRKVLLAGGVMANTIVKNRLSRLLAKRAPELRLAFTSPRLTGDNAAGIAYLTYLVAEGSLPYAEDARKGALPFAIES